MTDSILLHLVPAATLLLIGLIVLPLLKRTVTGTRVALCLVVLALAGQYLY
jgi:hypothetical protein